MLLIKFLQIKKSFKKTTFRTVLRQIGAVVCRGDLRICDLKINHKICGLAHLKNLRICHSGIRQIICGFVICGFKKGLLAHLCFFNSYVLHVV
jgi:hypothetical protein